MSSVQANLLPTTALQPAGLRPALRWTTVAGQGAQLGGAKLAAACSMTFLIVAFVAYWFTVLAASPADELLATLAAGTVSLAVAVLVFGLLCSLVAAVSGSLAALALVALLRRLSQPLPVRRALIVGLGFGLAVLVLGCGWRGCGRPGASALRRPSSGWNCRHWYLWAGACTAHGGRTFCYNAPYLNPPAARAREYAHVG